MSEATEHTQALLDHAHILETHQQTMLRLQRSLLVVAVQLLCLIVVLGVMMWTT